MKKSVNSNIYEKAAGSVWENWASYIEGNRSGLFCVVSSKPLNGAAHTALENSAASFGYGEHACTYVCLEGFSNSSATPQEAAFQTLSESTLQRVIEALDPRCLVLADAPAMQTCAAAYEEALSGDALNSLRGRDTLCFKDFEALMQTPESKQKAWALLKKLPRLS